MAPEAKKRKRTEAEAEAAPAEENAALTSLFSDVAKKDAPKSADPADVFKAPEPKRRKVRAVRGNIVYVTSKGKYVRTPEDEKTRLKTTVFVDNLPNDVKKAELQAFFKKCMAAAGDSYTANPNDKMTVRLRAQHFDKEKEEKGLFKQHKLNVLKGRLAAEGTCAAYVYFPATAAYEKALTLNGALFVDRHIRVEAAAGGPSPFAPETSIFVGNLLLELQEEELRQCVIDAGLEDVNKIRLVRDSATRKGKGFGFVSFHSTASAGKAYKLLNGKMLNGRDLRVKRCQFRSEDKDERLRTARLKAPAMTFKEKMKQKRVAKGTKRMPRGMRTDIGDQVWEGKRSDNKKELSDEIRSLTKQWRQGETGGKEKLQIKKGVAKQKRDDRKKRAKDRAEPKKKTA